MLVLFIHPEVFLGPPYLLFAVPPLGQIVWLEVPMIYFSSVKLSSVDDDIYKDQGVLNAFSVVEKNSFVNPYPEIGKTKGSIKSLSPMKKTTRAKSIAKKTKKNKDVQKKQKIYRQQKKQQQQQHLNLHQQEEPKEMQQDV
ncbi:hypothetical protein Tco_0425958 [Tanacetum coccineum]